MQEPAFATLLPFCSRDLDLMKFIYEPDPYPPEIYQKCENELPVTRLLKVIV